MFLFYKRGSYIYSMKKKGQFYLVAVVILMGIFLGLLTIYNGFEKRSETSIYDSQDEINIERGKVLDYISENNLDDIASSSLLENFASLYIDKIGDKKNVIFIVGSPSETYIMGHLKDENLVYNSSNGNGVIESGDFSEYVTSVDHVDIDIGGNVYNYEINPGQNIYYLVQYNYNGEVYIVNG